MADFICKLGTEAGEIIEKRFTAESEKLLQIELQQKGYYIFRIRPAGMSFFSAAAPKKIKPDAFIVFNQEMKSLLSAGLPATRSLDILIARQGQSDLGRLLKEVRDSIETGSSISEAFAMHKERLPPAYVASLVAGERSGDLAEAIERYVTYAKLVNNLRKNFQKALYYPAFLITLSAGMISLMLLYVLPEFSKFYEGFEQQLPALTLFALALANGIRDYWPAMLTGLVLFILMFRTWRATESGKRGFARFMFGIPLIGTLLHKYQMSQIFHSLSVMLKGGMPLVNCLEDLQNSSANPLFTDGLRRARQRVSEGEPLTAAIGGTVLATDMSLEMVQVGESTGALPEMLANVATFYDEEVQNRTEALLSLVEPVLLAFMAIIVGTLLFAMYYPLFNLLGNIG